VFGTSAGTADEDEAERETVCPAVEPALDAGGDGTENKPEGLNSGALADNCAFATGGGAATVTGGATTGCACGTVAVGACFGDGCATACAT
jgi:hypothetical protein